MLIFYFTKGMDKIERFDYPFPIDESNYNEMLYKCTELTYVDFNNFSFEL